MTTSDRTNMSFDTDNLSELGNFTEILGTDGFDSLTGSDLEIIYGIGDGDSLVAGTEAESINILVGGTGRNLYSVLADATAIIFENGGSDDNTLFTNVRTGPGIDRNSDRFIAADVENRHLFFGDTESNQYVFLVDWQETENQIETFYFLEEIISYETFASSYQESSNYLGNLSWSELAQRENIDLERLGLDLESFDDEIDTINARAAELELEPEPEPESRNVGNFSEILGTDGYDSLWGADSQILYTLAGDDSLNSILRLDGGSLPDGGETTILVGGSGNNSYQARKNSTAIIVESSNSDDNLLYTTIGNDASVGIGLEKSSSFFAEIDDRHLYLGDTVSNQYAVLIDWQESENQIENFDLAEGRISYSDFSDRFRNAEGYRGNITWSELAAERNLQRLGLDTDSFDDEIDTINARALELELEPESDSLDTDIFRFQNNDVLGTYIYVTEPEAQNIRENFDNFTEEGLAFQVAVEPGDDLIPMYRFQSEVNPGTYLFVGELERDNIRENFTESFSEEGLAFYTYDADSDLGTDFYRFQNTAQPGTYLFATGEERDNIRENFPNFEEEGIAFSVDV